MINNQGFQFIIFTLDGLLIGTLFDIFRVLRKSFKTKDFITYIEDIIFWILVGLIFIYSMYNYCGGELRLFMVLGIFFGISIYIVLISKYFIKISVFIVNILKKIISIILKTIYKLICFIISKTINPLLNFIKKLILRPISILYKKIRENTQKNLKILSKNKIKRGDFLKKRRNI